ncbi:MAG: HAD family hydrolase [Schwartzia sp.]|nr:HAD family hydrolase [Schwartzia sp. (in: firmicutes)]
MTYRAAVFDLDGTLINSITDLAESSNELLASYNRPPHPVDAYRYYVGNGSRTLMERILPEASSEMIDEALARYKRIYEGRMLRTTAPYEGIPGLLAELRARRVRLGVCTNKHRSAAERMIGELFPAGTFDSVVGDRPGVPRKPDPANVFAVLAELEVGPDETVYLGDSGVDMETAVRAGALPVGVLWGFREKAELLAAGAELLLSHPSELLEKVAFGGKA